MLNLGRVRLLVELQRLGTVAAVADAVHLTPSAVSQQLAVLQQEVGVQLVERAGRGVRLTDAAVVLASHGEQLLQRAARAESDLAAASTEITGRVRIGAFQSVSLRLVAPALRLLAERAPALRCELLEVEPEHGLPALAGRDLDLVLADEWPHRPRGMPPGVRRHHLGRDAIRVALSVDHPLLPGSGPQLSLAALAEQPWVCGHAGSGWSEVTLRTCIDHGGFAPDVRHRTSDALVGLELVAEGQAVALMPDLVGADGHARVAVREPEGLPLSRELLIATRAMDDERPSVRAAVAALCDVAQRPG